MIRTLALAALIGVAPLYARAAESAAAHSARATATLITDSDTAAPGQPLHIALRLRMAPGWHTYWRNPGDAGVAPQMDVTLPSGAQAGPIAGRRPSCNAKGRW